jgi:glutamate-1-semialdehyde 2,1-aminomutase
MIVDREFSLSEKLYDQACGLMPGGVNSPVRAFRAVGGTPLYFQRGNGSKLIDVNGNEYIDYVSSWGAIITVHAKPIINHAIGEAAANGTSFGAPHEGEIRLAKQVIERMPSVERVRFVNSGTEAALAVVRLARAATGRSKIIKFEGNYHGAIDSLLSKAGSGIATFGLPDSAGVPKEAAGGTLTARYNDLEDAQHIFDSNVGEIAAVIVEPVAGNMGLIPPQPGFLLGLRRLCTEHGALLVLDEVMTGFRVGLGGATERYRAEPDLLMMGKVIGGGLPVGAYGGKKELMDLVAPLGPMYQAGTLSGNPLAMAAGSAALQQLTPEAYDQLESIGSRLEEGLKVVFLAKGCRAFVQRVGSMISVFFTESTVQNFSEANVTDKALYGKLFHALLKRGVYLPPSALESWFINLAHSEADIDKTVNAFNDALTEVLA